MIKRILVMVPNAITENIKKIGGYIFSTTSLLYQISGILNYNNYNVISKNFTIENLSFKEELKYIINNNFNYIYMIVTTNLYNSAKIYSNNIKKYIPNIKIIIFHEMSKEITNEILDNNYADIVAVGEEDYIALDIANNKNLKDINGISYKDDDGNIIHNKYREPVSNLDNLPNAIYGYSTFEKYLYDDIYIFTSRGCPGKCIFCGTRLPQKVCNIRYRNPELIVNEIKELSSKYNINKIKFLDSTFTSNREYIFKLMDYFDKYNLNIQWYCHTRVDYIDKELLYNMKNHGCFGITYGVESTDINIMKFLGKNISVNQIEESVNITKEIGLQIKLHFMIGSPGETIKSVMDNINLCKKLNPELANFHITTPKPGLPLYEYCEKNNLLLTKDWDMYSFQNQIIHLNNIKDYKIEKLRKISYEMVNNGYTNNYSIFKF
jgi:radical SAM superfamily enzyme YgiQ (UPF0313 family)